MSTDTAAEAAERVRIRAENFPGTVSDDADLRSHLSRIVGEEKVDEVIDLRRPSGAACSTLQGGGEHRLGRATL